MISKDIYTAAQEKRFLAWIREQPSWLDDNEPCEPCHIRRLSEGSGMGRKPRLFAVPMTREQHLLQGKSEADCIVKYGLVGLKIMLLAAGIDSEGHEIIAKHIFSQAALEYRNRFLAMEASNGK